MIDTEKKEFTKILIMVAELFDKDLSENLINLYFHALKDLELSQIKTASNNLIKSATFFPKPVDFRQQTTGNSQNHHRHQAQQNQDHQQGTSDDLKKSIFSYGGGSHLIRKKIDAEKLSNPSHLKGRF